MFERFIRFAFGSKAADERAGGVATIGAIVFARMASDRLPGKALTPIGPRPLIGHVLDRVRRVRGLAGVALATSTDASDDRLAEFARSESIPCWRGSADNVVERAVQCARWHGWDAFFRVCGDRVFLDPLPIEAALARIAGDGGLDFDILSNIARGSAAPGLTVEVIRTRALETVLRRQTAPGDLEHITRYVYEHPSEFRIRPLDPPPAATRGLRFAVDTPKDLERARHIVSQLDPPADAGLEEIIRRTLEWEQRPLVHA